MANMHKTISASNILALVEKVNDSQKTTAEALKEIALALSSIEEPRVPRLRQSVPVKPAAIRWPAPAEQWAAIRAVAERLQKAHVAGSKWASAEKIFPNPRQYFAALAHKNYDAAHETATTETFKIFYAANVAEVIGAVKAHQR